jgi:C_GCAxxG_C_C family probable redox protein
MSAESEDKTKQTEIESKIRDLLLESGNCAQTSFAVLSEEHKMEASQVLRALTPFPGIALRGETCGAVIGSLMAIGIEYGRDDLSDYRGFVRSLRPARRFCSQFEESNGSTACREILKDQLGREFDLSDRVEAIEYAQAGGAEICIGVVKSAVEIASREIDKMRSKNQ